MESSEVYHRLTLLLRSVFDDEDITARPELTADLVDGWDSFTHVRLVIAAEREFDVTFNSLEVNSLENIGTLATLIESKLSTRS